MRAESRQSSNDSNYAQGPFTKPPSWHWLVVFDIWLNNLTTGLFLVAGLAELTAPESFAVVARSAYPIAFGLLIVDLILLVLDLGDPWRFHHMLRVFKPSSPMSLGTWFLTVYSLPLAVLATLSVLGSRAGVWHSLAVVTGMVPALGTALYKGVLFSTSSQPGWRDARWLGSYLTSSSFMLGCAQLVAISVLLEQDKATEVLLPALGLLLLLNAASLSLLLVNLRKSLGQVANGSHLVRLSVATVGGGIFLPLVLVTLAGEKELLVAVFLIVAGALVARYQIVQLPELACCGETAADAR